MLIIDKYAYNNNLNNVSPYRKVFISLLFLIMSLLIKNIIFLISISVVFSFIIIYVAKIDFKTYIKLLRIPLIFLAFSVMATLINITTNDIYLIVKFKVCGFYIGTSFASIDTSIHVFFRSMSCIICIYFCILTTPFNQLIYVMKKIKLPNDFIELTMLTYRFIFIFLEESSEIYKSQELKFGYCNLRNSYRSIGILASTIYSRLMTRYEDMCISLDVKLYDGEFHIVEVKNV